MKNKAAVSLGRLGGLAKKTMTPQAIQQRSEAVRSRWRKYRARNKRKPRHLRNVALLVIAIALIGSGVLIYIGETSTELWATDKTKNGPPSLEIVP